jgi:hypothetical protein
MVMSIQDLEERIKDLQAELEGLKENTMKGQKKDSPWALVDQEDTGYTVGIRLNGEVGAYERENEYNFNVFKTQETAKGFANAFHAMVALRQCEGAGDGFVEDRQEYGWFLDRDGDCMRDLAYRVDSFTICPPFPSEDLLRKAVEGVGEDKIIAAYEFLATGK